MDRRLTQRVLDWLFDMKHPVRPAFACLAFGLANAYEAVYWHPNSLMSIVDWVFALGGLAGFLMLLLEALSGFLFK